MIENELQVYIFQNNLSSVSSLHFTEDEEYYNHLIKMV